MSSHSADSRGSLSGFTVCLAASLMMAGGLVASYGSHIRRYVAASDVAGNAARVGGQQVVGIRSGDPWIDRRDAESAARRILVANGLTGSVTVSGNKVVVAVTVNSPALVGFLPVDGVWSSEVVRESTTVGER